MTDAKEILEILDSTLLRPDVLDADIQKLCDDAKRYEFAAVIVNPLQIKKAKKLLRGSPVKVGTVIAFPQGEEFTCIKVKQIKKAIKAGAQDLDVVAPISQIKQGNWEYVEKEIKKIKRAAFGKTVKIIIETGLLTSEEIIKVTEICVRAGVRFIKTCTGFYGHADKNSVKLIIDTIKKVKKSESALGVDKDQNIVEVKASGGIKTLEQAYEFYNLGVKRIGTSSAALIAEQALVSNVEEEQAADIMDKDIKELADPALSQDEVNQETTQLEDAQEEKSEE
ncbi:MAG TPA: deoxyribose-phosphate aldolase [Clostridia bacterium]|jgi:deoxyribose-phosphate aldolase